MTSKEIGELREKILAAYSPMSYGAKCDGVTDDTAAIQAAVNAAEKEVERRRWARGRSAMTEEEWQEHLTRTGTYPVAECASCKETRVLEFFEAFAICASCLAASLRRDVPKPETWRDRPSLL